jgi:hypothetical protein
MLPVCSVFENLFCFRLISVPATVVYYTMYDRIKYALGYNESNPDTKYLPVLAGSAARGLFIFLSLDVLRKV